MIDVEKYCQHGTPLAVLSLILMWSVSAWFIAEYSFRSGAEALVGQETLFSQKRAADLADSIQINLNYPHGIPDLLSELLRAQIACVSASLGIAIYPLDTADNDHLIRNADQARYAAKNNGRNSFSYFHAQS